MTISAEVDERTLREIHLPAFEAAVKEAEVWCVMTAYNKVNGIYCGEQPDLIGTILRTEWGFDGLVMSDWFGTHSTAPLPRPARPRDAGSVSLVRSHAGRCRGRRPGLRSGTRRKGPPSAAPHGRVGLLSQPVGRSIRTRGR